MARRRGQSGKTRPPLEAYLRRRRWRRGMLGMVVIAALAGTAVLDRAGYLVYPGGDMLRYDDKTFQVERVIDGDTLVIDAADRARGQNHTRVRLWGIDTPELAYQDEQTSEPLAEEAREAVQRWVDGESITLKLEAHRPRGHFGRVLAFVELPSGELLGERLLKRGLAEFEPRWRHRHFERYRLLEEDARKGGRGLWGLDE